MIIIEHKVQIKLEKIKRTKNHFLHQTAEAEVHVTLTPSGISYLMTHPQLTDGLFANAF